jgi:ABC-2 type transport system ATP-binding protein
MIEVERLSKRYGEIEALRDVSFSLEEGEIAGFLGPNGAGKTTTMRIITGCLSADSGVVRVGDHDVFKDPKEVKRLIGYLPEHPPLYDHMTVDSYLDYVARLKDVPRRKIKALHDRALKVCGLKMVRGRLIKHLSKGYRQRVGIAQAIIHDPKVLILDEPTIGLDPKQITEIRALIRGLAGGHTVILSTHIIPEVTMICQKVIIIRDGKIAAMDSLEGLSSKMGEVEKTFVRIIRSGNNNVTDQLMSIPGMIEVVEDTERDGEFVLEHKPGLRERIGDMVSKMAADNDWGLVEIRPVKIGLEEIFVRLVTQEKQAG